MNKLDLESSFPRRDSPLPLAAYGAALFLPFPRNPAA
jgi:hypothetical protein